MTVFFGSLTPVPTGIAQSPALDELGLGNEQCLLGMCTDLVPSDGFTQCWTPTSVTLCAFFRTFVPGCAQDCL